MNLTRVILVVCMFFFIATPSYAAPGIASIAWLPGQVENGEAVKIDWDMWWGMNGDSWYLTDNQVEVCKGNLTPQGQISQSSSCTANFTVGQHDLQVSVCIDEDCSMSNVASFTVTGDTLDYVVPTIALSMPTIDDNVDSTD